MFCLLSMTAARIEAFAPGTLTPTRSAWLNMQAVKHLQRLRPEHLDHRTLYNISYLAARSAYKDNYTAARTHFKAFSQLLPLVTINVTHEYLMHFILVWDMIFAMYTGEKPMMAWPAVLDRQCRPPMRQNISKQTTNSNTAMESSADTVAPPPEGLSSSLVSSTSSNLNFSMGSKLLFLSQDILLLRRLQQLLEELSTCSKLTRFVFLSPASTPTDAHALFMSLLRLYHSLVLERVNSESDIAEAVRVCISSTLSNLRTRLSARTANWNAKRLAAMLLK